MNRQNFLKILNILSIYKTKIKIFHWAEITSYNKHHQLDELYDTIDKFQDSFAEDGFMIFGNITPDEFPEYVDIQIKDATDLINKIVLFAEKIKTQLNRNDDVTFSGLQGLTDSFIHDTKIIQYRWQMA